MVVGSFADMDWIGSCNHNGRNRCIDTIIPIINRLRAERHNMNELIRETPIRVRFVNVEQYSDEHQIFTKYETAVGNNDVLVVQLKSNRADRVEDRI